MDDLHQFLHSHRTDGRPTHLSLFGPKGKYVIGPTDDYTKFMKLYKYHYTVQPLGIAEMQTSLHIPVLIDVDLKIEYSKECEGKRLYNDKHVQAIVHIYQKVLSEIVQDVKDRHLICFFFEKPPYRVLKNGIEYFKNGFHLHFPFLFMSRYQQEHLLLPRVRLECKKLAQTEYPECSTPDSLIDRSYCKGSGQPWLLYGSRKEATMEPYIISRGFDSDGRVVQEWWNLLLGFDYNGVRFETKTQVEDHLPEIFSIRVENKADLIVEIRNDIHHMNWDNASLGLPKPKRVSIPNEEDEKIVKDMLELLSPTRSEDRNEWIRVGWILYNIFHGDEKGYTCWTEFSRRCPEKFNETVCRYEWSRMEQKDMTLASLKYLARKDNPEGYAELMCAIVQPYIDRCMKLDGSHNDLAVVLFHRYESEFKCGSIAQKVWYQFKDHIWQKTEEGVELRKKISSEIVEDYERIAKQFMQRHLGAEDEDDSKSYKKKMNNALKMISKLKTSPFKTNVMKEAMEVFYDEYFIKKLDSNPYLIGFQNGMYNLKTHEFRDGEPNDYISLKMSIRYRTDFTMDCQEVIEVQKYFEKIFPDQDVREYFLNTASDVFIGGNFNKIVQVWTGEGDNGKSITQSIFEQMLGPYAVKLPTALITGKRTQSSAACPELVRAGNGVRLAVLQEPDQKDVVNIGILKELSGNDTFFARGLFKEGSEITPMFKLVLICNELPNLHNSDRATWNRIRVIPFEATFSDNAPETFEEQLRDKVFPKDPQFKDKIPGMTEALAWFLLEKLKTKPKIVSEPDKVVRATEHYKRKNDIYRLFSEEFIENKENKSVQLIEMYSTFKDWFRESFPNSPLPSKIEMKEYFSKRWGDPVGVHQVWTGHCIRSNFDI